MSSLSAMVAFTRAAGSAEPSARTLFHAKHLALGGHLVPFNGWEMPLYYAKTGIMVEHQAVRQGVGVFDVSHMSVVSITGKDAAELLSLRTPTNVHLLKPGACRYSFFLNVEGEILDDAVIARVDEEAIPRDFLLISNAGMAPRVLELLLQHRLAHSEIERWNGRVGILAVQGPKSTELLQRTFGWDLSSLKFYTGTFFPKKDGPPARFSGSFGKTFEGHVYLSRTGYTGEVGYEVFVPEDIASETWDRLVSAGAVPCGLGARDTLRMEKGYLLSGSDFHADRTPLEAGLDRFVAYDHRYVGRPALEKQKTANQYSIFSGLLVEEKNAIPRHGTKVLQADLPIAEVTSGGLSPTLQKGIALAYLPQHLRTENTSLEIDLRGRKVPCKVVSLPFVR